MFKPDYNNLVDAAYNRESVRTPLYEHSISTDIMHRITGKEYDVNASDDGDLRHFFTLYNDFYRSHGYDTVTFEGCVTEILPGGGALGRHVDPAIKTAEDFDRYPFDDIKSIFFNTFDRYYSALSDTMPDGMKAVGGVGNGMFEIAQDLMGYENLMLTSYDDPDLYARLYRKIGDVLYDIWTEFLSKYSDTFCVMRFGDDLGYKTNTLAPPQHIRNYIIPEYKRIVDLVHTYRKPFLFHCCGCIFKVMDDIINVAGIDAKHSNEDVIAGFSVWVDRYGDRIGNFGGIDTDHLCTKDEAFISALTRDTMAYCSRGHGGFALSSGNSIPDYVDPAKYLCMINTAREFRGDFR